MPTFDGFEFAKRLKVARINAAFDRQEDLADAIDVSSQSISFYERGRRLPDASILSKLAEALNCSSDYLLQIDSATSHEKTDIVNQTGLSEIAIDVLCNMQRRSLESIEVPDGIELYALDALIRNVHIHDFLLTLYYFLYDDLSSISFRTKGGMTNYSLSDVVMITFKDKNESTTHGIFKEDLDQTFLATRLNQLQGLLLDLRNEIRKEYKQKYDDSQSAL